MKEFSKYIKLISLLKRKPPAKRSALNPEAHWSVIITVSAFLCLAILSGGVGMYYVVSQETVNEINITGEDLFLSHSELQEAARVLEEMKVQYSSLKNDLVVPKEPL